MKGAAVRKPADIDPSHSQAPCLPDHPPAAAGSLRWQLCMPCRGSVAVGSAAYGFWLDAAPSDSSAAAAPSQAVLTPSSAVTGSSPSGSPTLSSTLQGCPGAVSVSNFSANAARACGQHGLRLTAAWQGSEASIALRCVDALQVPLVCLQMQQHSNFRARICSLFVLLPRRLCCSNSSSCPRSNQLQPASAEDRCGLMLRVQANCPAATLEAFTAANNSQYAVSSLQSGEYSPGLS